MARSWVVCVGLKEMPVRGLGRYSVWKGWIVVFRFGFASSGTSHKRRVPEASRECAATIARADLPNGWEFLPLASVMAMPSLTLEWRPSEITVSPQVLDPAFAAEPLDFTLLD